MQSKWESWGKQTAQLVASEPPLHTATEGRGGITREAVASELLLPRIATPSAWEMQRVGMMIDVSVPSSIKGGPATLLAIMTATAPLFWAIFTFTTKLQTPRLIRATLPVSVSAIDVHASLATATRLLLL
jgi:hypothetical protein